LFIHPKSNETRYAILETMLLAHPHYSFFCGMHDIMLRRCVYGWKYHKFLLISGTVYLILVLLAWVPRRVSYAFKLC